MSGSWALSPDVHECELWKLVGIAESRRNTQRSQATECATLCPLHIDCCVVSLTKGLYAEAAGEHSCASGAVFSS